MEQEKLKLFSVYNVIAKSQRIYMQVPKIVSIKSGKIQTRSKTQF